jgi:GrpB-like predicted nucleotidyltransferase (UPF0157 family)
MSGSDRPGPIVVEHYNPEWPHEFERVVEPVRAALGEMATRFEHVGSTSVPGLAAKPILDIDVVIPSREVLPQVIRRLADLGYEHRGDLDVPGREAFRWVPGTGMRRHLYVCAEGALPLLRHIALRDALRADPVARERYATLKRELAAAHPHDMDAYVEGKSALIAEIMTAAGVSYADDPPGIAPGGARVAR